MCTYKYDIPHCCSANGIVATVRERPIKDTVGTIVSGPINLIKKPRSPVLPMITCVSDASIRLPEI